MTDLTNPNTRPTQVFFLCRDQVKEPVTAQRMTGQKASSLNILLNRGKKGYRWLCKPDAESNGFHIDETKFTCCK
jgi:hypothetical protein